MTLATDIADDLLEMDGVEQITLTRRVGNPQSAIEALRRKISNREMAISDGRYSSSDVRFHVRVNDFELTAAPVIGDTITDSDGEVWTILAVSKATLDTRYACHCRNLAIQEDVSTLVEVQVATYSKGSYGEQIATWSTVNGMDSVRGKIQLVSGDRNVDDDRLSQSERYRIYFLTEWSATPSHRIIGDDGKKYRVLGINNPEDITQLFSVDAEIDSSEV